jgi:RNA polymerase sigma-70 factor (ECF subfamily)
MNLLTDTPTPTLRHRAPPGLLLPFATPARHPRWHGRFAMSPSPTPHRSASPEGARTPWPAADPAEVERAARDLRLAALLRQVATGRADAFEAFYDATVAYAQALARRMVRGAELDDVLAESYFQVWRDAPRFDAGRGSAVGWLLTIVRSRALDALRRRRAGGDPESAEGVAERPSEDPGPPELLAATQAGTRLYSALAALSAQERWLLGLAYFRELSHSQISQETGLPLGSVKSAILRAQAKLRRSLA